MKMKMPFTKTGNTEEDFIRGIKYLVLYKLSVRS